jgi:hypothetical protein
MGQVATITTRASAAEVLGGILAALPQGAPQIAGAIITAQSADETASWTAMHNWNVGNVTTANPNVDDWMLQGSNPIKFRAFPDLASGAAAMVAWLSTRGVLPFAYAGDIAGYVGQLAAHCYLGCIGNTDPTGHTVSQDDYNNYQAAIAARTNSYLAITPIYPPSASKGPTNAGAALILGAAAVVTFAAVHTARRNGHLVSLSRPRHQRA